MWNPESTPTRTSVHQVSNSSSIKFISILFLRQATEECKLKIKVNKEWIGIITFAYDWAITGETEKQKTAIINMKINAKKTETMAIARTP